MKSSNEMVKSLLERRAQYDARQKQNRKILIRTATSLSCVCLVALLGVAFWRTGSANMLSPDKEIAATQPSQKTTDAAQSGGKKSADGEKNGKTEKPKSDGNKTADHTDGCYVNEGDVNDGKYKDFNKTNPESAVVWPWKYMTVAEKYTTIKVGDTQYGTRGRSVSEKFIGSPIGSYTAVGHDEITGEKHTANLKVYRLKDIAQSMFVAVKADNAYYVFMNSRYNPPQTLGKLFEAVPLANVIELKRFSENDDAPDGKHFILQNDDYIWQILSDCKSAPLIDSDRWQIGDTEYLTFTVSSDALGNYKDTMYITSDGYLCTNAFDWEYVYNIGRDAASKIINYAMKNSTETSFEPYNDTVIGKVTEITRDYVLVDDSVVCKNPADGTTYKVLLDDIRISRYVDRGFVKVGQVVQVDYEGEIDRQNSNAIGGAISFSETVISGGKAYIPE